MVTLRIIKVYEDLQTQVKLTEQEQKDILLMKAIIGKNNIILQANGMLLVRHYVGFVQVNKTRLLIYPKISKYGTDETYNNSFNILLKLLFYSGFIDVKKIPTSQYTDRLKGDLLELFISIFIDELLKRFKRDVYRNYNQTIENKSYIKGKIDFSETIRKNSYSRYKHYVKFDDFTENILLNQIFKSVIHNLLNRTTIKENKIKLRQCLLWLEDVERVALNKEIWQKVQFNRLNNQYRTVYNMAKLFYFNSSPNLNKGDELTFSFLVPVNQLFERYLYKVISNNTRGTLEVNYQGPTKYLAKKNGKDYMQLKPDITISKEGEFLYILDAKYKEICDTDGNLSISQTDIYQMLAYSIRYKCNKIALLYPKLLEDKTGDSLVSELLIEKDNNNIRVKILKVDLEAESEILAQKINKELNNLM